MGGIILCLPFPSHLTTIYLRDHPMPTKRKRAPQVKETKARYRAKSKLDRDILLQTLAGYAEVNKITAAERDARMKTMTDAEAMRIFVSLYETWKRTGKQAGGNWDALARWKLEQKIQIRKAFETFARAKGLI